MPRENTRPRGESSAKTPPLELEPPEALAEKAFWLGVMDELDEILEYKWLQSEKVGYDIGMDRAIREWLHKHYTAWAAANPPAGSALLAVAPSRFFCVGALFFLPSLLIG